MDKQYPRKRGRPVKLHGVANYTVYLDKDHADWAKGLSVGLSGLIRELIAAAYLREHKEINHDGER